MHIMLFPKLLKEINILLIKIWNKDFNAIIKIRIPFYYSEFIPTSLCVLLSVSLLLVFLMVYELATNDSREKAKVLRYQQGGSCQIR
jgi:hypothetical protein